MTNVPRPAGSGRVASARRRAAALGRAARALADAPLLAYRRAQAVRRPPDPVPEPRPFPKVVYAFAMGGIPPEFAGRTKSVLTKTKAFSDHQGAECVLLTMNHSARFAHVVRDLRRRGLVGEHVRIVNMFDVFAGVTTDSGDAYPDPGHVTRYPVEIDGLRAVRDPDAPTPVYRYYDADGEYVLYRKYDDGTWFLLDEPDERLFFQDHFADGVRTRRESYDEYGTRRFVTYFDPATDKSARDVFYRADGTAYLERWMELKPGAEAATPSHSRVFDERGRTVYEAADNIELIHRYFDLVFGDRRVILSVESRKSDPETLTYHRDNVKQVYVFHNPHIRAPFKDLRLLSAPYAGALAARDAVGAVVFLTQAQRADAEAALGRHANFAVIPHPMSPVAADPAVEPDPRLAVMLARLDQQKQVDHAISAFARVVAAVPDARLEIYGRGTDEKELGELIDRLGLGDSVRLMGYTSDPAAVYQRAAVSMLTSRYEGFGLVVLESLANGCPVVAYDIRYGPSDMIKDGRNGFLVPSGDVEALAERVASVLRDDGPRQTMRAQARATLDDFTPEAAVARWSALFAGLDAGWGRG